MRPIRPRSLMEIMQNYKFIFGQIVNHFSAPNGQITITKPFFVRLFFMTELIVTVAVKLAQKGQKTFMGATDVSRYCTFASAVAKLNV